MIIRSVRLQRAVDAFWDHVEADDNVLDLHLNRVEWRQAEYLIQLTQPYALRTAAIGVKKTPTIDKVWETYNSIISHLEESRRILQGKRRKWKHNLIPALDAAKEKLTTYYKNTADEHGAFYNFGNILNPRQKNSTYRNADWGKEFYTK
jgi:hypothetical protein